MPESGVLIEVAPGVEDDVGLDAAACRVDEGVTEFEAGFIGFDDETFEEDKVFGRVDIGQHVIVEVAAVGVDGGGVIAYLNVAWTVAWKLSGRGRAALAHVVNGDDRCYGTGLRRDDSTGGPFRGTEELLASR